MFEELIKFIFCSCLGQEYILDVSEILTVCDYYVTYAFQSESTLYSCLNVKEPPSRNRRDIWSLSDSNRIRTHNHLIRKRTTSLDKWLSVRLRAKWLGCESRCCHLLKYVNDFSSMIFYDFPNRFFLYVFFICNGYVLLLKMIYA